MTTIVPANVGVVANAPNKAGAEAFVDYLLSPAGQELLLDPKHQPPAGATRRSTPRRRQTIPIHSRTSTQGQGEVRRRAVGERATTLVDALFDQLITFRLEELKAATKAIHDAEAALAKKDNAAGRALVKEARDLIAAMPVTDAAGRIAGDPRRLHRRQGEEARARPSSSSNGRRSPRNVRAGEGQGRARR